MFTPGENLLEWLTDKRGRDQFVLRCAALRSYWAAAALAAGCPAAPASLHAFVQACVSFSGAGTLSAAGKL